MIFVTSTIQALYDTINQKLNPLVPYCEYRLFYFNNLYISSSSIWLLINSSSSSINHPSKSLASITEFLSLSRLSYQNSLLSV